MECLRNELGRIVGSISREGFARLRCLTRLGIERQPEAIGQSGQVIEHADDVGHLEAALVVEAERPQWLPVGLDEAGRGGT